MSSSRNDLASCRAGGLGGGGPAADGGVAVERRPLPEPVAAGRAQEGNHVTSRKLALISGNLPLMIPGRRRSGRGVLLHVCVEHRPLREGRLALGAHVRPHTGVGQLRHVNEVSASRARYQHCRKWMFWVRNLHPERAIYGNVDITLNIV